MAKKRLLFIEDLYDFYLNKYKRSTHFNAEKSGKPLVVQVRGKINFDDSDKNKDGLLPVHLQSCHTDLNVNNSNIETSVMEAALPSFSNRPILGYIHKVVTDENPDGQWEFYSHNMHEDENGDIVYDEYPIGIIPESCNAQLVYDEDKKKTYCEVDGYIFEEYSKAAEILQREEECAVSVELSIRELSYDAKQKFLNIEDFWFSGVTILGKTPQGDDVRPGMAGSNIKLADFSSKNNSLFEDYDSKVIELQERLEKLEAACFNKEQNPVQTLSKEGGEQGNMTKFEELLAKYNKTAEDITFDYAELSDEELEAKFEEIFGENENTDGDDSDNGESGEPSNDGEGEGEDPAEPEGNDGGDNGEGNSSDFSVKKNELFNQLFEISFDEIRYALNTLCSIYRNDSEWCYVYQVYEDYFIMEDWDSNKYYKQSYEKDGDNISLSGERIEMFAMLLTESEKISIEEMRSNYAELKAFKETVEKNELHAQREEIINSEKYSVISAKNESGEYTNEAFAKLVSEMDNYSLADLETQIKVIHSDYIAEHSNFSTTDENKTVPKKQFVNPSKSDTKPSRYGKLFQK